MYAIIARVECMFLLWLTTVPKGLSIVLCYTCSTQATMEHIPNCVVDFDYHTTKFSNFTTLY